MLTNTPSEPNPSTVVDRVTVDDAHEQGGAPLLCSDRASTLGRLA